MFIVLLFEKKGIYNYYLAKFHDEMTCNSKDVFTNVFYLFYLFYLLIISQFFMMIE